MIDFYLFIANLNELALWDQNVNFKIRRAHRKDFL